MSARTRKPPAPASTRDAALAFLRRRNGARLDEITAATGWQPHSARAILSGLRKAGHAVVRTREEDGTSRYRLLAPEAAEA